MNEISISCTEIGDRVATYSIRVLTWSQLGLIVINNRISISMLL